jgi:hypothetical protein
MKKLLLVSIIFVTLTNSFSQSPNKWLDSGSDWHYSIWYFMFQYPTGFNHYYYAQDTIINNITFQQVKVEQQLRYDNGNGTYTLGDTTFLGARHFTTSNDTVYLLAPNNTLRFLWYNNPLAGDIWDYGLHWDYGTGTYRNAYSMVDSIQFITVNGEQLKEIYSHSVKDLAGTPVQLGDTALFVDFVSKINTKFGPTDGLNKVGQFTSSLLIDETTTDKLLCFKTDSFPLYQVHPNINCNNNIILSINVLNSNSIQVFPNPFNSIINIKNIPDRSFVKIYDYQMKLIKQKYLFSDDETLNLERLENGIYFLLISDKQGQIISNHKLIKNGQ